MRALTVVMLAGLALAPFAPAATDPVAQLADRYAPVVRIVSQEKACGHGEPYLPANVDVVLGNRSVALRGPWATPDNIVKIAPTAADLAAGLTGYHLDFPGNALSPGCDYEKWGRAIGAGDPPTTYARVVTEPGYPGKLALQYWFFYVFNDWNDLHEGDWEMIQLDWNASSISAALATHPYEVGFSQHQGAERADWGASKLQLVDGTHPVVYPALGSHANYFTSALHLGRSADQGVGCDDTIGPSTDLLPTVLIVPSEPSAYLAAYPWLGYLGHWGEEHTGYYNGPTGPNTKLQWTEPITWADTEWRDSSATVPNGGSLGVNTTNFFCGAVAAGSNLITRAVQNPTRFFVAIGALLVFGLWLFSRTRWDVSTPFRIRRARPWGSLISSAFELYRARMPLFLGIGLLFIPLGILITAVQYVLFHDGPLTSWLAGLGGQSSLVALIALALGFFFTIVGLSVVQAAVTAAMVALDEGREVGAREAYREVVARLRPLLGSLVRAALIVAVFYLTIGGMVIGTWLAIRWSTFPQVVMLEDERRPLRRSARIVRGHWWRAASLTAVVTGTGLLLGPLVGVLLLFVTSASFNLVNLVASLVYVFTLPFAAIVSAYLYFDLLVAEKRRVEAGASAEILPAEA